MTVYSNGPEVQLGFPDAAQLVAPLIQPVAAGNGARIFRRDDGAFPADGSDLLFVTPAEHWYRADDEPDVQVPMPCRGCGASGKSYIALDAHGRCPRPPSAQDIADALIGRTAVAA